MLTLPVATLVLTVTDGAHTKMLLKCSRGPEMLKLVSSGSPVRAFSVWCPKALDGINKRNFCFAACCRVVLPKLPALFGSGTRYLTNALQCLSAFRRVASLRNK